MTDDQSLHQQLASAIVELPQEALVEVLSFVEYQRYKFLQTADTQAAQSSKTDQENSEAIATTQTEAPLYERLSPNDLAQAFLEWAESHRDLHLPHLSDEAISRESIYGERG
ncbi:hypothetical protein ACN4EG_27690 [Alkalinema pantanalense CENA528]|uniref:hypothetical protein n=1 Tax=Alkalinema pantanalense TaxID=1620705 RepID=UPI003D6EADFE